MVFSGERKKTGDTMQILSESIRHPNSPIIPLSLSNLLLLLPSSASFSGYTENQTQSLKISSSSEFIGYFLTFFIFSHPTLQIAPVILMNVQRQGLILLLYTPDTSYNNSFLAYSIR